MSFSEHTWARVVPLRAATLALALVGALTIAGCGAGAATSAPPANVPTADTSATAAPGATGVSSGGDCGAATLVLVKQALASRTDIVSVTGDGGCHDTTIVTSLGDGDAATALAICDLVAPIAYGGDLLSITITGATTKELSIGIKGADCIGEP